MLFKVLRKLKLNSSARVLLIPVVKCLFKTSLSMSASEAEMILSDYSPDPGGSVYYPGSKTGNVPLYDLDIIVPVYNMETYLPDCAASILHQKTSYNFRAIFIDDGSKDNSGKILDSLSADPRVLVIHQENRGLSGARNRGLDCIDSRYLMFVDSDDRLAPDAVETMLSVAIENDAALVQGCFGTFYDKELPRRELSIGKPILINPSDDKLPGYAWGKLIRSDYFQNLRFPAGYWFEDSISAQFLYPMIRRDGAVIVGIDNIVYHYRQNPVGISRQALKRKKSVDSFWVTRALLKESVQFGLKQDQATYEYVLDNICLTYIRTQYQPKQVRMALLVLWNALLEVHFPKYHTCRKAFEPLETAVKLKNYQQYSLLCRLL